MKRWRVWWGRRKERLATVFLTLLVAVSLGLSALIWTGTPIQITVDRPGFFTRPTIGGKRSLANVTIPSSIFLWTANNELFRMSGDSQVALGVMWALQQAQALTGGLRPGKEAGDAVPSGSYLQINVMMAGAQPTPLGVWFRNPSWSSWPATLGPVYIQATHERGIYRVRYFTGRGLWQGTVAAKDPALAAAFTPTDQATPYAELAFAHSAFDLPYDQISMPVEDWTVAHSISAHVIDSFFADPTSAVALHDRSHSILYTDGLRGVRVVDNPFGESLTYLAPSAKLVGVHLPITTDLAATVSFINQNGGFVGSDYLFIKSETGGARAFVFQEIVAGWPLFSSIGQIAVWTQDGTVTRMTRNLAYLQELIDQTQVKILSGNQVLHLLGTQIKRVQAVRLGYGISELSSTLVELDPVYQISYAGGKVQYMNAQTGQPYVGTGMIS